jgi:hypothetical protein
MQAPTLDLTPNPHLPNYRIHDGWKMKVIFLGTPSSSGAEQLLPDSSAPGRSPPVASSDLPVRILHYRSHPLVSEGPTLSSTAPSVGLSAIAISYGSRQSTWKQRLFLSFHKLQHKDAVIMLTIPYFLLHSQH